ncbi:hypothetical protein GQ42DRAFT_161038, partial [Ramicandelaber brevisporus]
MLALWLWWLSLLAELLSFGAFSSTLSWSIKDIHINSGIIYAFLALMALFILFASYNVSSWCRGGVQQIVRQRLATTIMAFFATAVFAAATGYTYRFGRPPVDLDRPCTSEMRYACSSLKALSIFIPAAMSAWGLIFFICIGSYCSGTPQANNPQQPAMEQYQGPHPPPYPGQYPGQNPGQYSNQYQYGYYPNHGAAHPPAQPNSSNLSPVHVDYGPLRPKYDPVPQYPATYPPPAAPPSATHRTYSVRN